MKEGFLMKENKRDLNEQALNEISGGFITELPGGGYEFEDSNGKIRRTKKLRTAAISDKDSTVYNDEATGKYFYCYFLEDEAVNTSRPPIEAI